MDESDSATFHPSLEDENGGHAVDRFAALFNGEVGLAEQAVGFGGGKALVPKMNWKLEMLAQVLGEGAYFFGLRALVAAHAKRKTDDNFLDVIFADDAVEMGEVVALVFAVERVETLRGDAEGVGDGDADAASADVEAEHAAGCGRVVGRHGGIISGCSQSEFVSIA